MESLRGVILGKYKIWGLVGLAARARKICFGADV